ncbi:MAG: hypothetical protein AB7H48_10290, partial [Parachlamydiales bacterium]
MHKKKDFMSLVPQITRKAANAPTLVDTKDIVKYWPDDVINECSKRINKLSDIRTLSLLSKHFFLVVFNDKFPTWQTLLASHFPSTCQRKQPIPQPILFYKHLKAINHQLKTGTHQTRTLSAQRSDIQCLSVQGASLISGSSDSSFAIWDLKSGDLQRHVPLLDQKMCYCMTIKGEKIFCGLANGTITVGDVKSGVMLHSVKD